MQIIWDEDSSEMVATTREDHSDRGHFFFLRAFFAVPLVFSIKKSSAFFPSLIAATSQRGLAPRPAHNSPDGPVNFGATFVPFKLPRTPRATLPPIDATELPSAANCFSRVER